VYLFQWLSCEPGSAAEGYERINYIRVP